MFSPFALRHFRAVSSLKKFFILDHQNMDDDYEAFAERWKIEVPRL